MSPFSSHVYVPEVLNSDEITFACKREKEEGRERERERESNVYTFSIYFLSAMTSRSKEE
jgi:hypothetical protein